MNSTIQRCDTDQLLRYQDGELPSGQARAVTQHLAQCDPCRRRLSQQAQIHRVARQAAETAAAQTPRPDVAGRLMARIQASGRQSSPRRTFWAPRRWIPVGVLAIVLLVGMVIVNPWQQTVTTAQPSAIVESFQGNVSTVMILETQTTGQTIVWFKEISEPDGDYDGEQDAPPTVDRNTHPAAGRQWRVGSRA